MNKTDASLILAANVRRLMEEQGDSQAALAARAKVSQRAIGDLATYGRTHFKNPTLKTIEGIATAYGVPVWSLMVPEIPVPLLKDGRVSELVEGYVTLDREGQAALEATLSQERRYREARDFKRKSA